MRFGAGAAALLAFFMALAALAMVKIGKGEIAKRLISRAAKTK